MSIHVTSNRAALRAFVVIALSLFVICTAVPDIRRLWLPQGVFEYGTDLDGVVTGIDASSPADNAGMRLGDRVDVHLTPPKFRWFVVQVATATVPGARVTFDLIHQGVHRSVTLTAVPEPMSNLHKVLIATGIVLYITVVAIGAALVLLRPNPITWGFFFFCLATFSTIWTLFFSLAPFPMRYVLLDLYQLIIVAGGVGLLVFAFRFLREPVEGWRFFGLRTMPYVFILWSILYGWYFYQAYWFGGPPAELLARVHIVVSGLISLIALYAFVDTYLRARGVDRQRIQWVVMGFGISLAAQSVGVFLGTEFTNSPDELFASVALPSAVAPMLFAYAIIRHRVIDVSFVVSRALVYGILTTLLVGVFSIIDWFFTDYLRLARLGTIAEVGAVVGFGMWFNGLHKRVDTLIDATFFRQRHRAEVQLARNAAALPSATTTGAVAQALVTEPVRTLSLASAALFRHSKDGTYVREESEGWATSDVSRLDDKDAHFLMLVQTENGPLSLYDHPWRTEGVPSGPAHPVLALPIIVRRELAAVVLYGAHVHGEALDPDEIKAIAGLASGAAAAYDHLDAEAMRNKNESLQSEVESLRTQLAEAQIQPA